jgi:hypothetical protein
MIESKFLPDAISAIKARRFQIEQQIDMLLAEREKLRRGEESLLALLGEGEPASPPSKRKTESNARPSAARKPRPDSLRTKLLAAVRDAGLGGRTSAQLITQFPDVNPATLRTMLAFLKREGLFGWEDGVYFWKQEAPVASPSEDAADHRVLPFKAA